MAISVVGPGVQDAAEAPTRQSRGLFAALRQTGGVQRAMLITGAVITFIFLILALFAPWISPYGFDDVTNSAGVRFIPLQAPSAAHWFGTTNGQGFDVLSQVIYGARTELDRRGAGGGALAVHRGAAGSLLRLPRRLGGPGASC